MQYVSQNARFSSCKRYRYSLERSWNDGHGRVLFIGLNPSTADHRKDDPTIRRCVGFAKSWGYNSMEIVNLFAYRATYPEDLKAAPNPIGAANDKWIRVAQKRSDKTIACWGSIEMGRQRAATVLKTLDDPYCLKINQTSEPAHPLYLRADLRPFPYVFESRAEA
ncbi:MAG: DUF1643 domain-containing protein [Pseudomonadales bacterium]|nr:DUF1643 domain-containing protein [Pseudomonadales bacterium]